MPTTDPLEQVGLSFCVALGAVGAFACTNVDGQLTLATAHVDTFEQEVQPVLARRCASPSCHGSEQRPFEVFAVHAHRLDPDDVYLDVPLYPVEVKLLRRVKKGEVTVLDASKAKEHANDLQTLVLLRDRLRGVSLRLRRARQVRCRRPTRK